MGSATTHALLAARSALQAAGNDADSTTGEELFAVSRVLGDSAQLRAAVSDPSTEPDAKATLVRAVFKARVSAVTLSLLDSLVAERWSSQSDLLAGIEEIGVRAIASSAPANISLDSELFSVGKTVSGDAELELALRSKLADPASKAALVERLLGGKTSQQTVALVRQLVVQPRGRSLRVALRDTTAIVADQSGRSIATLTSARPLDDTQLGRLRDGLSKQYGRDLRFNHVIDPSLIGGLRVQIGDDVIDSSVASRLSGLKLQLAG